MRHFLAFLASLSIGCSLVIAQALAAHKATHAVRRIILPRINNGVRWCCPVSAPRSSIDLDMSLFLAAYAAGSMACVVSLAQTLFR